MPPPTASLLAMLAQGLPLGWLVAWPPGPINAQIVRRALGTGFWSAWSLSLGACAGDFAWALAVSLGAGSLASLPGAKRTLLALSALALFALSMLYFRAAAVAVRAARARQAPPPGPLDSSRGGFALGLGIALTSPWNLAFWLGVAGHRAGTHDLLGSVAFASGVVLGAATWGAVLAGAVRAGARFATPGWQVATSLLTGAVLLYFAVQTAWLLLWFSRG